MEQPTFFAFVEAMVPAGGPFEESARDALRPADLAEFTGGPRALNLALWCIEVAPFVLPPWRWQRFSRLALADRVALLDAWERSRFVPLRQLVHLLKLLVMVNFYSRPEIENRIGYPHPLVRVPRAEDAA